MNIEDIQPGVKCRVTDPTNGFYGIELTVDCIEDEKTVRFVNSPIENYGVGIHYFILHYELL